jgi:hypothetical protein
VLKYKENTSERTKEQILQEINVPVQGRTNGACVQVNGEWSCGKSLFLCFIALERNNREGIPVLSNLNLQGIDPYVRLTDDIEILEDARNTLIAIDEIRRYMDSYLTRSKQTMFISNITADFGKFSNDFYYSDQSPTAAPSRVKTNISLVIYPKLDEPSGWVTVYCFYGITEYLMVEPFFYFGFYAPDYWWAYDTEQKIEDFHLKFPVKKYALKFLAWRRRNGFEKITGNLINLWDLERGENLSGRERDAILTLLDQRGIV